MKDLTYDVSTPGGGSAGTLTASLSGPRAAFRYECPVRTPPSRLALVCPEGAVSLGVPMPGAGGMYLKRTLSLSSLLPVRLEGDLQALLVPPETDLASLTPDPPEKPEPENRPENEPEQCTPQDEPNPGDERPEDECPEDERPEETCAAEPEPGSAPEAREGVWQPEADPSGYFDSPELRDACRGMGGVLSRRVGGRTLLAFPYSPSEPFPMMPIFREGTLASIGGRDYILFPAGEWEK